MIPKRMPRTLMPGLLWPHHPERFQGVVDAVYVYAPRVYQFGKWRFEYGPGGCWPLRADGEVYARAGKKFYADLRGFFALTDEQKESHRIGGGCIRF